MPHRDIPPAVWEAARDEAADVLAEVARGRGLITYAALAGRLRSVRLRPGDPALARLLREISTDDRAHGRGMRSALVVFKHRGRPGAGFFALARELGADLSDREAFWQRERERVYADWLA